MGKHPHVRRFDPRYGVGMSAVEAEATALAREVEDYRLLAIADLNSRRDQVHGECKRLWEQMVLCVDDMPERERTIIQAILFRDFYFLLELNLAYLRINQSVQPAPSPPKKRSPEPAASRFSEWLFEL